MYNLCILRGRDEIIYCPFEQLSYSISDTVVEPAAASPPTLTGNLLVISLQQRGIQVGLSIWVAVLPSTSLINHFSALRAFPCWGYLSSALAGSIVERVCGGWVRVQGNYPDAEALPGPMAAQEPPSRRVSIHAERMRAGHWPAAGQGGLAGIQTGAPVLTAEGRRMSRVARVSYLRSDHPLGLTHVSHTCHVTHGTDFCPRKRKTRADVAKCNKSLTSLRWSAAV